MAYHSQAGPSNPNLRPPPQQFQQRSANYGNPPAGNENEGPEQEAAGFDTLNWYRHYIQCHEYFLDRAQHDFYVQAVAAFINIQLPYQRQPYPVNRASASWSAANLTDRLQEQNHPPGYPQPVSLIPYIKRLIVTGHDDHRILGAWFGADWVQGIGTIHEMERRNYLFASKSKEWLDVKKYYDDSPAAEQSTPYMIPPPAVQEVELHHADEAWSNWMAMQDWVIGPRTPEGLLPQPRSRTPHYNSPRVKRESDLDD
ncbi:hypothetical protein DSL72_008363 [Monilinia vaccinii-corymbosi]|uniref:Ilp is an apoptosis inhibitor n=1 Tax=Monilinia vaccinii-corymbosi TaxID=61207 RepID=A0A8A3PKF5_9HELO|nr:hypothetical protein DSL72_008363 [Monilinia vaccinii-corymbosi]